MACCTEMRELVAERCSALTANSTNVNRHTAISPVVHAEGCSGDARRARASACSAASAKLACAMQLVRDSEVHTTRSAVHMDSTTDATHASTAHCRRGAGGDTAGGGGGACE